MMIVEINFGMVVMSHEVQPLWYRYCSLRQVVHLWWLLILLKLFWLLHHCGCQIFPPEAEVLRQANTWCRIPIGSFCELCSLLTFCFTHISYFHIKAEGSCVYFFFFFSLQDLKMLVSAYVLTCGEESVTFITVSIRQANGWTGVLDGWSLMVYPRPLQDPVWRLTEDVLWYILCRYGNDFRKQWHIETFIFTWFWNCLESLSYRYIIIPIITLRMQFYQKKNW